MDSDKMIFGIIAGVTVLILVVIVATSFKPTIEVDAGFVIGSEPHAKGADNPQLTLVEYSDFECPFCSQWVPVTNQLVEMYPEQLQLVYRHFPLVQIHTRAVPAAQATEAAANQDKFWEYHDTLFQNQPNFSDEDLVKYAEQLGLDVEQFNTDRDSDEAAKRVKEDADAANDLAINSTPTFYFVHEDGTVEKVDLESFEDLAIQVSNILGDPTGGAPGEVDGNSADEVITDEAAINPDDTNEVGEGNAAGEGDNANPPSDFSEQEQGAVTASIADLIGNQDLVGDPLSVTVVSIEETTWNDATLGCVGDDIMGAQVITPGYTVVLEASGVEFEYHTDMNGNAVYCNGLTN